MVVARPSNVYDTHSNVAARHISEDTHVQLVSIVSSIVLLIYKGDSGVIELQNMK